MSKPSLRSPGKQATLPRLLFFLGAALLSAVGCTRGEGSTRDALLAQTIWQTFRAAEEQSFFVERLTAETLAEHRHNVAFLGDRIPPGYPEPYLPYGRLRDASVDFSLARAPFLNADIVALGEKLFFDERLSFSAHRQAFGGVSCASCHEADRHFTDEKATSTGIDGEATPRNTPTIINAAYLSTLTWANPAFPVLEMQARIPLFGDDPVEMGLRGKEREVLEYLFSQDEEYVRLVRQAFALEYPKDLTSGHIDYNVLTAALAAYERSLIRFDTRFDRFLQGRLSENEGLSDQERKGLRLFFGLAPLASGDTLACAACHAGPLLTNSFHYVRDGVYYNRKSFHNTGLYNLDGQGAYPEKNTGFANTLELSEKPELMGQFRTPPLRFVPLTAPYGHDGSLPTLTAVIEHYAAGGRASRGPNGQNPYVDPLVQPGFTINEDEIAALLSFLEMLQ